MAVKWSVTSMNCHRNDHLFCDVVRLFCNNSIVMFQSRILHYAEFLFLYFFTYYKYMAANCNESCNRCKSQGRPCARIAWLGGHEKFIYVNSKGARGHEKFIPVWIKWTRWRPKIKRDFPSEIRNSNCFSGPKQVISKKKGKKGLHPNNVM